MYKGENEMGCVPDYADYESWLAEKASRYGIALSAGQQKQLTDFAELVHQEGIVLGLSGRADLEEILELDVLDALLLVPLIGPAQRLLDIGSGAGFPGFPLAIALPRLSVTLLEAKHKAFKFLKSVKTKFGLEIDIIEGRAEELKNKSELKEKFDVLTGRAVAPIERFLPWAVPFLKPKGRLILQKGKNWDREAREADELLKRLGLAIDSVVPGLQGEQKIIQIKKHIAR